MTLSLQHAYNSSEIQVGTAPSPRAPQCPEPVTVPCRVSHSFQFSSLPAALDPNPLSPPPPPPTPPAQSYASLFIPNSLTNFFSFFAPGPSPGFTSRSSSKFLGSALFQSHIWKKKHAHTRAQADHTTHSLTRAREVRGKKKTRRRKTGDLPGTFFKKKNPPPYLALTVNSEHTTAALSTLGPWLGGARCTESEWRAGSRRSEPE